MLREPPETVSVRKVAETNGTCGAAEPRTNSVSVSAANFLWHYP